MNLAYALMAVVAARELHRHVAKLAGWKPRYHPVRNHLFNAAFAAGALVVAAGGLVGSPIMAFAGWVVVGIALVGGTFVPCGYQVVNSTRALWYLRQLLFLALAVSAFVYAYGLL